MEPSIKPARKPCPLGWTCSLWWLACLLGFTWASQSHFEQWDSLLGQFIPPRNANFAFAGCRPVRVVRRLGINGDRFAGHIRKRNPSTCAKSRGSCNYSFLFIAGGYAYLPYIASSKGHHGRKYKPLPGAMFYSHSVIKSCTPMTSRLRGAPLSSHLLVPGGFRIPKLNSK